MTTPVALIIDDEQDLLSLLSITLRRMGVESVKAGNVTEALAQLGKRSYDLCLTDLRLPDGSGMDIVKHIQENYSDIPVAVITAFGDPKTAVEALKLGAFDYIAKPIEVEQLQAIIESSIRLSETTPTTDTKRTLLGESELMQQIRALINKVARNQAPVHINGETGTGKELIARLIHDNGPRSTNPFIAVNCGAIPRELMESEFFGHKKGSFTGAFSDKKGLFEAAHGGTLFLDEIADLPSDLQVKLLRTIQERTVRPVGEVTEKPIDVRLISATHKNLQEMIEKGQFREDLYYRVNVIPINAPSLRDRPIDIPVLAAHFTKLISRKSGITSPTLGADAMKLLASHHFPGNVRELENLLERTLALHDGDTITAADLNLIPGSSSSTTPIRTSSPKDIDSEAGTPSAKNNAASPSLDQMALPIDEHLNNIEKALIKDALDKSGGNITKAAALLGTTFRSLRYKIKKLEIDSS
ncbi:MAG: sigma-54 dependent transcriptional regulator [Acidiferrobacterales bacterium]|nr:sigma-54 dependent transcriptional regulator [Acidiferrobacterales bacterium]